VADSFFTSPFPGALYIKPHLRGRQRLEPVAAPLGVQQLLGLRGALAQGVGELLCRFYSVAIP
jgi:hypothetical protein